MGRHTLRRRDLLLREIEGGWLVISCDSCGAIGQKPGDALPVSNEILGQFNVRVPLLELLAVGAEPIAVSDAVSNEMNPTGREIIAGIQTELKKAGVEEAVLTGSTEENFSTSMTAVGVTAVGLAEKLRIFPGEAGDYLLCFGRPQVGMAVLEHADQILSYQQMRELASMDGVREIAPAGSGGVGKECQELAALHGLAFCPEETLPFSLTESAGPACCAVALVSPACAEQLLAKGAVCLGRLRMPGKEMR